MSKKELHESTFSKDLRESTCSKELHESTAAAVYLCPFRYFSISPRIFTPLSLSQSASAAEKIADMEKFSLKSIAQSQQAVNMSFDTMNALVSAVQTPKSAIDCDCQGKLSILR
jgi:hypothetical protein